MARGRRKHYSWRRSSDGVHSKYNRCGEYLMVFKSAKAGGKYTMRVYRGPIMGIARKLTRNFKTLAEAKVAANRRCRR